MEYYFLLAGSDVRNFIIMFSITLFYFWHIYSIHLFSLHTE